MNYTCTVGKTKQKISKYTYTMKLELVIAIERKKAQWGRHREDTGSTLESCSVWSLLWKKYLSRRLTALEFFNFRQFSGNAMCPSVKVCLNLIHQISTFKTSRYLWPMWVNGKEHMCTWFVSANLNYLIHPTLLKSTLNEKFSWCWSTHTI